MKRESMNQPVYVPPDGPPRVQPPSKEIYRAMGEENIFKMLEDFYRELATSSIWSLFPTDEKELILASQKSAAFFVGLLGGPPLYQQLYGPPMMRARHLPFEIDEEARREWLRCFDAVLQHAEERYAFPAEHLAGFRDFLRGFSSWMVNVAPADFHGDEDDNLLTLSG